MRAALSQLDAQILQRARHARLLEQRARRREEHAQLAAREPLERLHALARDLHVRLGFAESFARRIERERRVAEQRLEIGEPALRRRATLSAATTKKRVGRRRASAATSTASAEPGKSAGDEPLPGRRAAC